MSVLSPFPAEAGLQRLDTARAGQVMARWRSRCYSDSVTGLLVGHMVPPGLAAYCRILSPLLLVSGREFHHERWAAVLGGADTSDKPGELVGGFRQAQTELAASGVRLEPSIGNVRGETMSALVAVLERHTPPSAPCCYYYWAGRNMIPTDQSEQVYLGPLWAARQLVPTGWPVLEAPTAMWPEEDMAWVFAIHTDSAAAYLGGPKVLIDEVLASSQLETTPVTPSTPMDDMTEVAM